MATPKRRNRRQWNNQSRSATANVVAESKTPPEWPTGERITQVFEVHAAALKALDEVKAEDILAVLQKMPPRHQQFVVHSIGLHAAGGVNRGMASQILAQLHRQDNIGSSALLRGLMLPLVTLFDTDELSADEWAALGGDSSARSLYTLAMHEDFACHLADVLAITPPNLLQAGLVAAIAANTASASVARAHHRPVSLTHTPQPGNSRSMSAGVMAPAVSQPFLMPLAPCPAWLC